MSVNIRLVAADLDGTLLNGSKHITLRTAQALHACRRRGIHVCLASGRSFEAVRIFALNIGLDTMIVSCNGSRLDLSPYGPMVMEDNLPPALAREAAKRLIDAGLYVECYSDSRIYMANRRPMKTRRHLPGVTPDGLVEFLDDADALIEHGSMLARKLIVFSDDAGDIALARELLSGLDLSLSQSGADNLEIMAPGAGKGSILTRWAAQNGISAGEIMAFGDETNDLNMLTKVGWPVAMLNAVAQVKAACRLIAPSNEDDGVAAVLETYVLGGGA